MTYLLNMFSILGLILFFTKIIVPHQQEKSNKYFYQKTKGNEETFNDF